MYVFKKSLYSSVYQFIALLFNILENYKLPPSNFPNMKPRINPCMLAIIIFITPPLYVSRIMDSANIRRKASAATKDSVMDILYGLE